MDFEEILEALQRHQRDLEKLSEDAEGIEPNFAAFLSKVDRLEDPLERAQMELLAELGRSDTWALRQINLIMQRLVVLEQGVLVLIQKMNELTAEDDE